MARPGRRPADDTGEWEYVLDVPNRKAPLAKLPDTRGSDEEGNAIAWHPLTKAWWDTVRVLPHTAEWGADEWHALVGLAFIADTVYTTGQAAAHAEWRRGYDALGLTAEARRKLRIKLVDAERLAQYAPEKVKADPARKSRAKPAAAPPVSPKADRRARSAARA